MDTHENRLGEIFREYEVALYQYIYKRTGSAVVAEDLTSQVFLKALRWLQQDRTAQSIRSWLYATARTVIADHWHEQNRLPVLPLETAEELPAYEPIEYQQQPLQERVQHLLSLLPTRERDILTLRFLQGHSAPEVAQALGLTANNVRVLQLRALRRVAFLESQERNLIMTTPESSNQYTYTPQTQQVIDFACEEAQAFDHDYVGTEHILLGILREGSSAAVLFNQGITLEGIRGGVLFLVGRNQPSLGPKGEFTPRTRKVFSLAAAEAQHQGNVAISPQDLLTALFQEGEGLAVALLEGKGVRLEQRCNFCQKTGKQVARFFPARPIIQRGSNTITRIFICNECVERLHGQLS